MRLPRVVANAALMAVLAAVVVPGIVGSRNPSAPGEIEPSEYRQVQVGLAMTAMTTPQLELQGRSAGSLAVDAILREPQLAPNDPAARPGVNVPGARLIVRLKPVARPPSSGTTSSGTTSSGTTSSGTSSSGTSSSGGSWRYDPEISWYGPGFYGNRTACGFTLTTTLLGVAHRSLPCGTRVTFRHEGKTVTVRVVDRGPYVAGRTWDLTRGACVVIGHCFTGPIYYRIG